MKTACLLPLLLLLGITAQADPRSDTPAKVVLGPSNADLAEGAAALQAGNAEEGVRLTRRGLSSGVGVKDRVAGYSNLCAGLIMLERLVEALEACNHALEIDDGHWRSYSNRALAYLKLERYSEAQLDISTVEELNPHARTLKALRAMYRDAVDPVSPRVIIDDRREAIVDEEGS
jgi:tetratricopeptide (TPR) repeat protein